VRGWRSWSVHALSATTRADVRVGAAPGRRAGTEEIRARQPWSSQFTARELHGERDVAWFVARVRRSSRRSCRSPGIEKQDVVPAS